MSDGEINKEKISLGYRKKIKKQEIKLKKYLSKSLIKHCYNCITSRYYLIHFGYEFLLKMYPFEQFNVWYYQIPVFAGFVSIIWIMLKFWRRAREQQIKVIPASWNGIHAHQWSLIQCLTHRATCCLCQSLIVDAMYCDSCGVCLDFNCYNNVMKRSFFRLKSSEKNKILEPLSQCKRVSISKKMGDSSQFEMKHHWVIAILITLIINYYYYSRCMEIFHIILNVLFVRNIVKILVI